MPSWPSAHSASEAGATVSTCNTAKRPCPRPSSRSSAGCTYNRASRSWSVAPGDLGRQVLVEAGQDRDLDLAVLVPAHRSRP